jgi:hypothetical protein
MNYGAGEFEWVPTPEGIANSNLTRFIERTGEADLQALERRADKDPGWLTDQGRRTQAHDRKLCGT